MFDVRRLLRPSLQRVGGILIIVSAVAVINGLAAAGQAMAEPLTINEFGQLALRCGPSVAPLTLASIARTESRFQPLTINDNTTATVGVPATREIAAQIATQLIEAGHSVDLGLMQINSANLRRTGLDAAAAFDPCRSIAAAASILTGDYAGGETHAAQQAALRDALSRYNTGDPERGRANGYVHKVELAAREVVPALDVSALPATVAVAVAAPPPAPAGPPQLPTSWNVWAPADPGAAGSAEEVRPTGQGSEPGASVFADTGGGPAKSAIVQDGE